MTQRPQVLFNADSFFLCKLAVRTHRCSCSKCDSTVELQTVFVVEFNFVSQQHGSKGYTVTQLPGTLSVRLPVKHLEAQFYLLHNIKLWLNFSVVYIKKNKTLQLHQKVIQNAKDIFS